MKHYIVDLEIVRGMEVVIKEKFKEFLAVFGFGILKLTPKIKKD